MGVITIYNKGVMIPWNELSKKSLVYKSGYFVGLVLGILLFPVWVVTSYVVDELLKK
jgi:hypothetical protein